jgi:hypothetical protein
MLIDGKMSVGVARIDSTPPNAINMAITTKVYGRRSAVLISHIDGNQCGAIGGAVHRQVGGWATG